jgi:hypothetical protein
MPPRPAPSRIAQALEYLQGLKSGVGEFVGGVGSNLADRARAAGGLAYEALTSDPNIGRMTTAEFSQAAADRAPTPRLNQAAQDIGTIGRAIVTQPVETGKAIVGGEINRFKGAFANPQALGEYTGSLIDPTRLAAALRHRIPISELDVYHGTPHRFPGTEANPLGEFDASKIGTGEGAQAYGHGIYLAESPGVADAYRAMLAPMPRLYKDGTPFEAKTHAEMLAESRALGAGSVDEAIARQARKLQAGAKNGDGVAVLETVGRELEEERRIFDALGNLKTQGYQPGLGGSLYKADLPDKMIDRMLDWDKPLSEQSAAVREAIAPFVENIVKSSMHGEDYLNAGKWLRTRDIPASHLWGHLTNNGTAPDAAKALREAGIPGIRYLDAGSRGQGGSGTRNFVVFPGEEKKVRILERK